MKSFKDYINETSIPKNDIELLIINSFKLLKRSKYKKVLGGGNCGMVAYAITKYLNEKLNKNIIKLALIHEPDNKSDGIDIKEEHSVLLNIVEQELLVYHVFIDYTNNYYDEMGKIDTDYLLNLALDQYNEADPFLVNNIDIIAENAPLMSVLRNATNWSVSWEEFYNILIENKI